MDILLGTAGTFEAILCFAVLPEKMVAVLPEKTVEKYEIWIADPRTKEMFRIRKNVEGIELAMDWAALIIEASPTVACTIVRSGTEIPKRFKRARQDGI